MLVDDVWSYSLWKESADLDLNLQINYKWEENPAFEPVPLPALKDIVLGTEYTLASFGNGLLTTGQYVQVFLFSKTGERIRNISEVSLESALRERILYDYYKSRAVNERTYVNTINYYQVADAVYAMALLSSSSWL